LDGFRLPQVSAINLYTSAYMSGINQHLPFLHLPTLDLSEMSLPLLLSICSIGALYCFEKEQAKKLHEAASKLLAEVLSPKVFVWWVLILDIG
jgi:Fungal specific transcription factor domain